MRLVGFSGQQGNVANNILDQYERGLLVANAANHAEVDRILSETTRSSGDDDPTALGAAP